MYIARGIHNLPDRFRGAAVTIGNFDGVHQGHQSLMHALTGLARKDAAPALAMTFEPHPLRVLRPHLGPARITGVRGKARFLEEHGVDAMLIIRFSRQLAAMTPEDFVRRFLYEGVAAREVLVGFNFRFGAKGAGDVATLTRLGEQYGFGVSVQPAFLLDGKPVSSTRVREAVRAVRFDEVERLLSRPFEVEGRVKTGMRRGKGLGFPTANLSLTGILHPPIGVYVVEGLVDGVWVPGVANVGINPTFGDEGLHMEAHMLESCGDLYRRVLRVRFLMRLRDEVRFPDVDALKRQVALDIERAHAFFQRRYPVSSTGKMVGKINQ